MSAMEFTQRRSLYVETSVWGMIPAGQPPQFRIPTLQLLRRSNRFFISDVVLQEIAKAPPKSRDEILRVLGSVSHELLTRTQGCEKLAQRYIDAGIVSAKKFDDALHVAVATVYNINVLVSWNHRHIANVRKTEQYRGVNLVAGYSHTPLIYTPFEVLDA